MIVVSVSDLSLAFGEKEILSRVSFSVGEGDRLGIIGVNGAGKTTLLRAIAGEIAPESGSVFLANGTSVGFLAQNTAEVALTGNDTLLEHMTAAFPELLAAEAEIAALEEALAEEGDSARIAQLSDALARAHGRYADGGGLEFRGRARAMLLRMGFAESELTLPVSALSGGQTTRLALSRLLCREPDLLMLDEPTNHLDIAALDWLEDFLSCYRKTVILISHDRYFLDRVTNKTLFVSHHSAKLYPGGYTRARGLREAEQATQEKQYRAQQKEIARIEANIEFQRRCGQEHNFVTIRSKQKQIEHMEKIEAVAAPEKSIRFSFSETDIPGAENVVEAKDLSFSFGEKELIRGLSFLVRRGEHALFLGPNGCGKSTLMKLLTGRLLPQSGRLRLGENVTLGYYDQENVTLDERNTVFGEMRAAYPQKTDGELRTYLARFLFYADDIEKSVRVLSGGERARLSLCKLMLKKVNLLVLDEPTNHLDIGSREVLEEALSDFGGTVVAVSHDRYFINRIATRLIELDPTAAGGCRDYPLGQDEDAYAAYTRLREAHVIATTEKAAEKPNASQGKLQYEQSKREAAARRAEAKRLAEAEARIPVLEKELGDLEAELFGPAASDYIRAAAIEERRAEIEEELLALYEITMG